MKYRFYKENKLRWYIDLPSYPNSKSDLEMVMGADDFLDIVSNNGDEVVLDISTDNPNNEYNTKLIFINEAIEIGDGAYYLIEEYNDIELNLIIWLCDVTKFVFDNQFPNIIYFKKI